MSNELVQMPLAELGGVLVKSGFFADTRDEAQAIVKVLAGAEIGFGPVQSMTGIHIIKGKPTLGAGLIASAIKRTTRYNYRILRIDDKACEIEFLEKFGDQWKSTGKSTFTAADAYKAGTQNMAKFPRNMLFARAISNGAKWYCPDVFNGPIYTPEELGDGTVVEVESIPVVQEVQEATEAVPGVGGVQQEAVKDVPSPSAADIDHNLGDHIDATLTMCSDIQQNTIKKRAMLVYNDKPMAFAALKKAVANRGKTKLAELTSAQAHELAGKLAKKIKTNDLSDIPY